jgi:hypothetical protein
VHTLQVLLPAYEKLPRPQALHVEAAVAPTAVAYFPATQLTHAEAPAPGEYEPAAHERHAETEVAPPRRLALPMAHLVQLPENPAEVP